MNSKSVKLRAVEPEDVDFMLECENDQDASRWTDYRAPLSRNQLMTYALTYDADPFASGQLRLIAEYKGQSVGLADFYNISQKDSRAYIGITVHPTRRLQGYGLAMLEALCNYNEERLGIGQILAKVSTENSAALQLFDKAGYEKIALLPDWHKIGGNFHDFWLFRHRL